MARRGLTDVERNERKAHWEVTAIVQYDMMGAYVEWEGG